jgi:hypothetical protein
VRTCDALGVLFYAAVGAFGVAACAQPTPTPPEQHPTAPAGPPAPVCRDAPQGEIVARFAGEPCPWVAVLDEDELRLSSLDLEPPAEARGAPPTCLHASCRYEGMQTPLGPMLIAIEPTAESEVPRTVFLGVVVRSTELVFVDLWAAAGPAVIEDSTALGPAHALLPMKCGDTLGLFARARLPIGETTEPPPELRGREGIIALKSSAATRPGTHDGCTPLALPLP